MHQSESRNAYFLINAGHPTAVFRPPADDEALRVWRTWIKGGVAAISLSTMLALLWAAGGPLRPLEATVQMEGLAAKVEQAANLHPDTARELARLIDQRGYDCRYVTCGADLQARNSAARNRLETLIAIKAPLQATAGAGTRTFVGVVPISTASVPASK